MAELTEQEQNEAEKQGAERYDIADEEAEVLLQVGQEGEAQQRAQVDGPVEPIEILENHRLPSTQDLGGSSEN